MTTTATIPNLTEPGKPCANLRVASLPNAVAMLKWRETIEVLDLRQARRLARELLKAADRAEALRGKTVFVPEKRVSA